MTNLHEASINTLAEKIGICNGYHEKNGNYKETSTTTKEKFLNAMGYKTSTEKEINDYLNEIRKEEIKPLKSSNVLSCVENKFILPIRTHELTVGKVALSVQLENGKTIKYSKEITDYEIKDNNFHMTLANIMEGYHEVTLTNNDYLQKAYLILCPSQAFVPDWIKNNEKRWGVSVQLYALQSKNSNGIGTFTDLTNFGKEVAKQGGSMIALNPMHAQLTEINSDAKSPYFPISRNYLDPLYMDISKIVGYKKCTNLKKITQALELQKEMAVAKQSRYVNYKFISKYFTQITREIFKTFIQENKGKKNNKEYAKFMDFCNNQLDSNLDDYATYCVLSMKHNSTSWLSWDKKYHDKTSKDIKIFKIKHQNDILYYKFLQWQTSVQLDKSIKTLIKNNLSDGLFLDLAIGTMTGGYTTWAFPRLYISDVSVGAPADEFTADGQQWNLTPYNPQELHKTGYKSYSNVLRNTMKYANFLRLDHVIGLSRLFVIHEELGSQQGVYLSFPKEDMMSILCLESKRNSCVIVGEALGLVEDGFKEDLERKNILSFTLMIFERWEDTGLFKRPDTYKKLSVASTTNHDLPTMAGYYMGSDIAYERKLGLDHYEAIIHKETQREKERQMIMDALSDQNIMPTFKYHHHDENMRELTMKTQEYVAKSSSLIAMVNYHDLLSNYHPLNIPGTSRTYRNWGLKTPVDTEDINGIMTDLSHIMSKHDRFNKENKN